MSTSAIRIGVPALCVFLAATAGAQSLRGRVTLGPTAVPAVGVVITATDSAGRFVGRTLTTDGGSYHLTWSQPMHVRLRVVRIGYRPFDTPMLRIGPDSSVVYDIVVPEIRVVLDTVRVRGKSICQESRDGSRAFDAWQQARSGMIASLVTRDARTLSFTLVRQHRVTNPGRRRILRQTAWTLSGASAKPWISPSADSLAEHGYIHDAPDGGAIYFAPDLDVLVSDRFAADHCIRLTEGSDASLLGVAFEPVTTSGQRAGLAGVFWLHRLTSELRSVDFRYTNVSLAQERAGAGGVLEFLRLPTGQWYISRWAIEMPTVRRLVRNLGAGLRGATTSLETQVTAIHIASGHLAVIRNGRDTLWSQPPVALVGKVFDQETGKPYPGALVTLPALSKSTETGANGEFRIEGLLPGSYLVRVLGHTNAGWQAPPLDTTLHLSTGEEAFRIAVSTPASMLRALCGDRRRDRGALVGRALAGDVPLARHPVTIKWTEYVIASGAVHSVARSVVVSSDSSGAFHSCDLPGQTLLTVTAEHDRRVISSEVRIGDGETATYVELQLGEAGAEGEGHGRLDHPTGDRHPFSRVSARKAMFRLDAHGRRSRVASKFRPGRSSGWL